ncbi:MAG TPA: apolipoprotein N-acyltransferase [Pyrinomonadaceae bacterium]|nr:apolipoprotein N-acyltransferase [Pyrinomonadaceae bacterium]
MHWAAAIASAILLILSFPRFNFWPLAWVALVPLLVVLARKPDARRAFLLGWIAGAIFFYGSTHWLTFSMVQYGGIPRWLAYVLLLPAPLLGGLFIGVFALVIARVTKKWGTTALFVAPLLWPSLEWARLLIIGQLWNAIGYSQAFHPVLIQTARWGGVYLVGFLIVLSNAALAFLIVQRSVRAAVITVLIFASLAALIVGVNRTSPTDRLAASNPSEVVVIAVQPNVPMTLVKSTEEMEELVKRHVSMSEEALSKIPKDLRPKLVIWPESPMTFTYGVDRQLQELLKQFTTTHQTALLLNSQEQAPNEGIYNSAVLVNQEGRMIAQYDKIRLMPFGEYVPLPRWMPGASLIGAIVGDFTPGTNYRPMTIGEVRAGVFICIESAYPHIPRNLTREGADVLINISNDGYLGPTAVMQQHLSNAIFRAVENGRPILRVTNSGITAYITTTGAVRDATEGFQTAMRVWSIARSESEDTFYSRRGDLFVGVTTALSILAFAGTFVRTRSGSDGVYKV